MRIERLYAVVNSTPDYTEVQFITDDISEANEAAIAMYNGEVVTLDLAKLVELCREL